MTFLSNSGLAKGLYTKSLLALTLATVSLSAGTARAQGTQFPPTGGLQSGGLPANGLPANGLPANGLPANGQTGRQSMPQPVDRGPAGAAPQREAALRGESVSNIEAAVKALHDIKLAAQADGILQDLLFDEGAAIEKGQIVLTIDERTANAELAVAQKEFEAATAQASQDANLRFSKKVAAVSEAEYAEIKELYDRNSASRQETRRKLLEWEKANEGIKVAEVDHTKDILAAAVAKEKVAAANVQLNLRKVISPYDGIVVERLRDQGEWVKAGEPILRLVHMKEMKIEAMVPVRNSDVGRLQNAEITIRVPIHGHDWNYTTKIEFVSPTVEMSTCRIWAKVPNTLNGASWVLRDGMKATVDIKFATE